MRKDILLPGLALAGGALGLGLRRWQLASAYDRETQLFRPGAPATWALLAVLVLLALTLLPLIWRLRPGGDGDFLAVLRCPSTPFMTVMAASGFLFLGAGLLGPLDGMEELAAWRADVEAARLVGSTPPPATYPASLFLCAALCFPAGAAALLLGRAAYRGELNRPVSLLASFPSLTGLVWLFAIHFGHNIDPVLMRYGFALLAAALFALAHYGAAGTLFGDVRPRLTCFCALLGACVGLTALGGGLSRSEALLDLAFVLSSLAWAHALLRNCSDPVQSERMPQGGQEQETEPPLDDKLES